MYKFKFSIVILLTMFFVLSQIQCTNTSEPPLNDKAYPVDINFPKLPQSFRMGQASGVATDKDGEIIVFHRDEKPILFFNKDGNLIRTLGEGSLEGAHGLRVDNDNNIWTINYLSHTITKLDHEGNVLLTLGEKDVPGNDTNHFNQPTDIAFAGNGDFYITDGYINTRVIKFNKSGKFILQWGSPGTGPGQFNLPHAIQLDSKENVYVGDRSNNRIQVFNGAGEYIKELRGLSPYGLFIKNDTLYVADGKEDKVFKMTLEGNIVNSWGVGPPNTITKELMKKDVLHLKKGNFSMPHGITVGEDGSVYVVEINGRRVQRFRP